MRSLLFKLTTLFFISTFFLISCSDDESPTNDDIQSQVLVNVQKDTWKITKYIDSGDDELNNYTGYNFIFGINNVLTASNGTNSYTGTWSLGNSNSSDDSSDELHFNIFFTAPPIFEDLSDDWHFISQTPTKIELIDVSGGNGGTDYLTFEKN